MVRDDAEGTYTPAELPERLKDAISGLSADELRALLPRLLASAGPGPDFFDQPVPSRRRPRRDGVVTFRVRVDLVGTKPPLWRRLELASDLCLNEVHEVLQTAFGWMDCHLHEFASGPGFYDRSSEHYLCPFEVGEGKPGVPEEHVRLDEVLAEPGATLRYLYDFGDDWEHVIRLEAVLPRQSPVPRAVCTDGRRPGPAEDCGGVHGYELIVSATDPAATDHAVAVAEYARIFGADADPHGYAPTAFDIEEINEALTGLGSDGDALPELPGPLSELADQIRTPAQRRLLDRMIIKAELGTPTEVGADAAAEMVRPFAWLMDRIGADGIKLTGAGYLPPVHVEAAMAELGLHGEWIGKGNRETQTYPVLHLRETAQAMGLLRKYRGKLLLTPRGRAVRTDPVALWWHLAENTPPPSRDACENQAGLILLTCVAAARSGDDIGKIIAELLAAIGWMNADGTAIKPSTAPWIAGDTIHLLRRIGAVADDRSRRSAGEPTPDGVAFARAALRTWPSSARR